MLDTYAEPVPLIAYMRNCRFIPNDSLQLQNYTGDRGRPITQNTIAITTPITNKIQEAISIAIPATPIMPNRAEIIINYVINSVNSVHQSGNNIQKY